MSIPEIKTAIKKEIANDLKKAIQLFEDYIIDSSELFNEFIINKSRFNRISSEYSKGTIEGSPYNIELNKVTENLLKLVDKISVNDILLNKSNEKENDAVNASITDRNLRDVQVFRKFKEEIASYNVKDTLTNMANINPISKSNYEWMNTLIDFFEDDDNQFLDLDLKNMANELFKSLESFKDVIRTKLVKERTLIDGEEDYSFELVSEDRWNGTTEEYWQRKDRDIELVFDKGKQVHTDYEKFRDKILEKLLV